MSSLTAGRNKAPMPMTIAVLVFHPTDRPTRATPAAVQSARMTAHMLAAVVNPRSVNGRVVRKRNGGRQFGKSLVPLYGTRNPGIHRSMSRGAFSYGSPPAITVFVVA